MSIIIEKVSKLYGIQKALDEVSFTLNTGEIVGFLGPNGAGKSTMMKIITCFIPPSSGQASVYGYNVYDKSMDIRRIVGYLPEHNPLYLDMYIKEYLEFVAGMYGIKNPTQRVKEMIDRVGLGVEQHKQIGQLSKGYRQRVGLAQAIIHDPKILILDEPTTGLDPNQLVEIRQLIRNIGKEKTVLLSTHIMQEVEAICNRVLIINKGKIVADDLTANLSKTTLNKRIVTVELDKKVALDVLKNIIGVEKCIETATNTYKITSSADTDIRENVFQWAISNQYSILTLTQQEQNLEDIFQTLTQ